MAQPLAQPQVEHDADALRTWFVDSWRPTRNEEVYEITDVEGEVPREIHGTLYRSSPSQNVLPPEGAEALHLFDGDGLMHALRFDDGHVHYTGRFARNESFLVEEEEGRYCMNGVSIRVDDPTDRVPIRVQHNTNIVRHGDRLLALVENGVPLQLDARSLDPIGPFDCGGRMLGYATSAHPKIDAQTGQMMIHGYQPWEPYLQYYVIEPDGRCSVAEVVDAPYATMMHDAAITENHVVFPLCPVVLNGDTLIGGGTLAQASRWEPDRGLKFGIRSRGAGGEVRWFEARTPGFLFHFGNAYEANGKIYADVCLYQDPAGLLATLATVRRGDLGSGLTANPFLYEFDLATGACTERQLDDRSAEFPRCDDRLVGRPNRWGYAVVSRDGATTPHDFYFGTIVKYDREGGASSYHRLPHGDWSGEPVFVPRTPDADEDDGFVLAVGYEGPTGRSYVLVLDARHLDGAPLAKLYFRHRIPMGFHGCFAPGVV